MKTTMMAALAALMLVASAAPFATANVHEGDDCAAYPEGNGSGTVCKEATGPGGVTVKGAFGAGLAVCFLIEDVPFPCETAGVGGTFFNVTHWNDEAGAGDESRAITIWAKHVDGAAVINHGFEITGCADRDYSGVCTNADDVDDYDSAFSNPSQAVLQPTYGDATGTVNDGLDTVFGAASEEPPARLNESYADADTCDKDSKDCPDPTDAQLNMCIHKNLEATQINDDGTTTIIPPQWDQIVVFISSWVDAGLGGNVGDGTSTGTFQVWLDEGAFGC